MSDIGQADRSASDGANAARNPYPQSPWDIANILEQCVAGTLSLLARIVRTLGWMMFRPRRLAEQLASEEFQKPFCPPLAFLTLGILCGFALLQNVWTLSPGSIERLSESESGWVIWIAQSMVDEFRGLSLSTIIVRTMPTVLITVLLAAVAAGLLAGRTHAKQLASAICLVIGFRLFLRMGQGLWHLANVRFSESGSESIPASEQFESIMRVITWAYLAAMVYILFFAGVRFLTAVMQHTNRAWLRTWPVAATSAWGVSALLFLGTFIAPTSVWNVHQMEQIDAHNYLLKVYPLGGAMLDFSDEKHFYLAANLLIRNESERQVLVALPRQILIGQVDEPVDCHYESEPMLDGTCLMDAGAARVVRATWRLTQSHLTSIMQESAVPLVFQLGSVDDVMKADVQTSTMQIAVDPNLLAELSAKPLTRLAAEADNTPVR